jgi:hypothetical protein
LICSKTLNNKRLRNNVSKAIIPKHKRIFKNFNHKLLNYNPLNVVILSLMV